MKAADFVGKTIKDIDASSCYLEIVFTDKTKLIVRGRYESCFEYKTEVEKLKPVIEEEYLDD